MRISDLSSDVCSSDLAGIIEPGRDRMRLGDLAVVVLEEIGAVAVEHAGYAAVEARGVGAGRDPAPRRFDAEHRYLRVVEERVEQPDRVRSAADRGDEQIGKAP